MISQGAKVLLYHWQIEFHQYLNCPVICAGAHPQFVRCSYKERFFPLNSDSAELFILHLIARPPEKEESKILWLNTDKIFIITE